MSLVSYETRGLLLSDLTLSHACLPTCPHEWVCQSVPARTCASLTCIHIWDLASAQFGSFRFCVSAIIIHCFLTFSFPLLPSFHYLYLSWPSSFRYFSQQHFNFQSSLSICPFAVSHTFQLCFFFLSDSITLAY